MLCAGEISRINARARATRSCFCLFASDVVASQTCNCACLRLISTSTRVSSELTMSYWSVIKSLFRPVPVEPSRKCLHSNYYYIDDHNQPQALPNVDLEAPIIIAGETRSAVYVEDFPRHVAALHADGDIGFSKEYELIQNESIVDEHSSEHSQHSDNKAKNRYLNIIACKSTSSLCLLVCLHRSRARGGSSWPCSRELESFK